MTDYVPFSSLRNPRIGGVTDHALNYGAAPPEPPTWAETVGAMWENEAPTNQVLTLGGEPDATDGQIADAWASGWTSTGGLQKALMDYPWLKGDNESQIKLLEQPTPERFDYWLGQLNTTNQNNEILENSSLTSTLTAGIAALTFDPISLPINLLGGGAIYQGMKSTAWAGKQVLGRTKEVNRLLDSRTKLLSRSNADKAKGRLGEAAKKKAMADKVGDRLMTMTGPNTINTALAVNMGTATIDVAVTEALAQQSQPSRSGEDTAWNMLGTLGFAGVLGGAAGVYSKFVTPQANKFVTKYERKKAMEGANQLANADDAFDHPAAAFKLESEGQSAGAAWAYDGRSATYDPEVKAQLLQEHGGDTPAFRDAFWKHKQDHTRMIGAGKDGTAKKNAKVGWQWVFALHPSARMATAMNPEARLIGQQLLEQDYVYNSVYNGQKRLASVETASKLDINGDAKFTYETVNGAYKQILEKQFPDQPAILRDRTLVHGQFKREFNNELSSYMYDPDHVFSAKFAPYEDEIATAAGKLGREVFGKWEQNRLNIGAIESKATPSGQRQYFNRAWNRTYTRRNRIRLRQIIEDEYWARLAAEDVDPGPQLPLEAVSAAQDRPAPPVAPDVPTGPKGTRWGTEAPRDRRTRAYKAWAYDQNTEEFQKAGRKYNAAQRRYEKEMRAYNRQDRSGPVDGVPQDVLGPAPRRSEIIRSIVQEEKDWGEIMGQEMAQYWGKKAYEFRDEMEDTIQKFLHRVTGSSLGLEQVDAVFTSKHLKGRIEIPSKRLLELDENGQSFLIRDVMELTERFLRDAVPDYHIRRRFGDDGTMTKTMEALEKSYTVRMKDLDDRAKATDDAKARQEYLDEAAALDDEHKRVVSDITDTINMIKHNYGHPDDPDSLLAGAGKALRALNFTTKLGQMTISALTDLAYLVLKAGFSNTAKAIGHRFSKSIRTGKRGGLMKQDINDLSIVTELYLHGKARAMMNMDDITGMTNMVDRATGYASSTFSRISLMNRWNHTMKEITASAYMLKLRRHLNGNGPRDLTFVRDMGFNEEQARRIKAMWDTHGIEDGGIDAPNMSEWTDGGAVRMMSEALLRVTDSTIVTPGAGDLPKVMRKAWGRLIFQFQSFPVSIMSRVAIPALQRAPHAKGDTMMGIASGLTLGAMVSVMKDWTKDWSGEKINLDPAHLTRQAIDRSGFFGYYATGFRLAEDVVGLDKLFTGEFEGFTDSHRSRSPTTELVGPWLRQVDDVFRIGRGAVDLATGEGFGMGAASALRRSVPMNNLFYVDGFARAVQEYVMDEELE